MIKVALSDMDNTLIPFGTERVSKRALAAIAQAREAGILFGPATGRDEQELLRFFDGDASAFRTGILSNGKKIKIDGEIVWHKYIDVAALQRLAEAFLFVPQVFVVAYPAKTDLSNPAYVIGATPGELSLFERRYKFNGTMVDEVPDIDLIAATIACAASDETCLKLQEVARELCPEFDVVMPVKEWFDIIPAGVSKASGFEILCRELGISADEAVFFGDAENDLQIMAKTPNSVAVANATPAAREAANYHIGACAEDAVAEALEELALAAKEQRMPEFLQ